MIDADTDAVLKEISAELGALYSVRSDRQFCQMLELPLNIPRGAGRTARWKRASLTRAYD